MHLDIDSRVALVTGAARRIGAGTVSQLHKNGYRVVIHCHNSVTEANALAARLNAQRNDSAVVIASELGTKAQAQIVIEKTIAHWGRLDVLVNNASSFYPTSVGEITDGHIEDLFASNFSAAVFLIQAASPHLKNTNGSIVNIIDIHTQKPYKNHSVYVAAKNALASLTRSMALELAPAIRVNGISPGVILWPDGANASSKDAHKEGLDAMLDRIPLQRQGSVDDIANFVSYLVSEQAAYITGQIIAVDGGKSLV